MRESVSEDILKQLNDIVGRILKEKTSLTDDTALIQHKILDSLDFMDYIFNVQDRFKVEISDEDLEDLELGKVANMIAYLRERMGNTHDAEID